jgi:hypothetical protein
MPQPQPRVGFLFDELPTDMIYWEIFPYLDYNSRVTANLLLPVQDRLRTPLKKDAALQFQMRRSSKEVLAILRKQEKAKGRARNIYTLRLWRQLLGPHKHLLQYSERFRAVVLAKAEEWLEPTFQWPVGSSAYTRKTLIALLRPVTAIPFLREVPYNDENWSAIAA